MNTGSNREPDGDTLRNLHEGQPIIDDLVMVLDKVETEYAWTKALQKAASEFQTCIANCTWMIPNYTERRLYSERVSTEFVEVTANTAVGMSFCKRQQMLWSKAGADLVSQTRIRTRDGTPRKKRHSNDTRERNRTEKSK